MMLDSDDPQEYLILLELIQRLFPLRVLPKIIILITSHKMHLLLQRFVKYHLLNIRCDRFVRKSNSHEIRGLPLKQDVFYVIRDFFLDWQNLGAIPIVYRNSVISNGIIYLNIN
jgi:hypothetical protein